MESAAETQVTVRQAEPNDADYLIEFTKEDKWDYSAFDYQAALSIDPEFLLVAVDATEKPVGFGGIIKYSNDIMYIDAYIVRADLRRKGIGRQIWKALLRRGGQSNICLDARLAVVGWYKNQGFIHESFTTYFYTANLTGQLKVPIKSPYEVIPFTDKMWPALLEYDNSVYPDFNREKILRAWFKGANTVVALADGNIVGYGSIHKKWQDNYGIRNVCGDNKVVAETVIRHLCATLPDEATLHFAVIMDTHLSLFKTNLKALGSNKRLYTKSELKINTDKIWMHYTCKV